MKRFVGLSLMAGVLFTCMAASPGQAAPVSGAVAKLAPAIQSSGSRQPSVLAPPLAPPSLLVAPWLSPLLVMPQPRTPSLRLRTFTRTVIT